ncbi:MAG TPA: hypothetical protein VFE82_18010 [Ramlibacter sp.]|jgi:hypothetical protein|uniref:hypothetical protein n=1 Tax=Ramlibacter sp. TaxID=1917967 RepID=UPI002D3DF88E|nr:hypothetical protein [Ramlibacter sp.]HZY20371.1 hypothetical protein [Ramlibacter sp.]
MQIRIAATLFAATLVAVAPLSHAQTAPKAKPAQPATAKAGAKAAGSKLAPSARKAVEEVTPIDDDPAVQLTDADLEVAKQVFVGEIKCELGASVRVRAARRTGLFVVTTRNYRFLMHPVESRTGAIRLEDAKRGAMWLQLGNKSMLMSQKLGQRLADECQSPEQLTFAEELKKNPRPSILEPMAATGGGMNAGARADVSPAGPQGGTTPSGAPMAGQPSTPSAPGAAAAQPGAPAAAPAQN